VGRKRQIWGNCCEGGGGTNPCWIRKNLVKKRTRKGRKLPFKETQPRKHGSPKRGEGKFAIKSGMKGKEWRGGRKRNAGTQNGRFNPTDLNLNYGEKETGDVPQFKH